MPRQLDSELPVRQLNYGAASGGAGAFVQSCAVPCSTTQVVDRKSEQHVEMKGNPGKADPPSRRVKSLADTDKVKVCIGCGAINVSYAA